uniref:bacillithiol biosynthesis cysteine-adding enzyme BshC n=2 Tax=Flavobacterium sp. TaxID=239 RepID=UPI00404B1D66
MPNDCVSYENSGYFSNLMIDYLNEKENLQPLYGNHSKIENFKSQIEAKQLEFKSENRLILKNELLQQYENVATSDATFANINLLEKDNTFTIVTGHQLNLFTGPLYFIYKIISTIKTCEALKNQYPDFNFVPIYWMATEDHDFEEINHFKHFDKTIRWETKSGGPVGRIPLKEMQAVFDAFSSVLGLGESAKKLKVWFENAYLKHTNLAEATRYLANEIFKDFGLVIIDADRKSLKQLFVPILKKEIVEQTSFQAVQKSIPLLEDYFVQVNPREINLFYMTDAIRERIVFEANQYHVLNTDLRFSEAETLQKIDENPENFSPNVILRPLYQEVILPNLGYVGGGGELAYWLELKPVFESNAIVFPVLLLRNSVLLVTEKQAKKADKLGLTWQDLFLKKEELKKQKAQELSNLPLNFEPQKEHLKQQFEVLYEIAAKTDISFKKAVAAQECKQIKGLENLEKKLLKAEKRTLSDKLDAMERLQEALFPNGGLQERVYNFAYFYEQNGQELIENLMNQLKPFDDSFTIVEI